MCSVNCSETAFISTLSVNVPDVFDKDWDKQLSFVVIDPCIHIYSTVHILPKFGLFQ